MKRIKRNQIKYIKKFKKPKIKIEKKEKKISKQTIKILLIILLILILLQLYFKNIFSSKYNKNKNYNAIKLLQPIENINISSFNLEDHYKLLLPKKKHHNIPKIKKEDRYNLFKLENSNDYKKMKETGKDKYMYYSCLIAPSKHENLYVREFIEYYLKLGVEKFYFGDDNPDDVENLSDIIDDYIKKGIVDIDYIRERNLSSLSFTESAFQSIKSRCKWILIFDVDEFLEFTNKSMTLKTYLEMPIFDKCDVIRIHWIIYDDNDLVYYDNRPVNERFTHGQPHSKVNVFHKPIIRGKDYGPVAFGKSPHSPDETIKKQCSAEGHFENPNPWIMTPRRYKYCYIKHFKYRTAEEFALKLLRGRMQSTKFDVDTYLDIYFSINKFTDEKLKVIEHILKRTFPKYHKNNTNKFS